MKNITLKHLLCATILSLTISSSSVHALGWMRSTTTSVTGVLSTTGSTIQQFFINRPVQYAIAGAAIYAAYRYLYPQVKIQLTSLFDKEAIHEAPTLIQEEDYDENKHTEELIEAWAKQETGRFISKSEKTGKILLADAPEIYLRKLLDATYRDLHQNVTPRKILINTDTRCMAGYY